MAQRFQQAISSHVSVARVSEKWEIFDKSLRVILFSFQPWRQRRIPWKVRAIYFFAVVPLHLQPFLLPSPKLFPTLISLAKLSPSAFSLAWENLFMSPRMSTRVNGVSIIVYHWIFSGEIENFLPPLLQAVPRISTSRSRKLNGKCDQPASSLR